MKHPFFILLFAPFLSYSQTKIKHALFIGNSYTAVNNLPLLVANIAKSNGDSLFFDSNCPGGYTFNNHFQDAVTKTKIAQGNWDYVVLQAQSQEPAFSPAQVNAQTLPFAIKLDSLIDVSNPCGQTVFYETWGRKNGDAMNCPFYPPICTYTGMQAQLRESYLLFADTCKAIVAPAGEAWRASISYSPSLELYQPDQSHPSLEGSFLTACVLYESLFKRSVMTCSYNPGINTGVWANLKFIASSVVNDSLILWNQGEHSPWARFTFIWLSSASFQFQSKSAALSNKWYFGDGNTSLLANPSHTFSQAGLYTVSHVVTRSCEKDSSAQLVSVSMHGLGNDFEEEKLNSFFVFPQPCTSKLEISASEPIKGIALQDLQGRALAYSEINFVDMTKFSPGIYILKIIFSSRTEYLRIFKE